MKQLILLFAFLYVGCVASQKTIESGPEAYAATITAEELKAHLYIYASDDFMGREAGTKGEIIAINYLKSRKTKRNPCCFGPKCNSKIYTPTKKKCKES